MSKFKAGDKALHYGKKVEIGGEMIDWGDKEKRYAFKYKEKRYAFKYEDGTWDWGLEDCLQAIIDNKPRRGQEFFIKFKFSHIDLDGDRVFHYENFAGDDGEAIFLPQNIKLYIKNAEGQIVPYNIHTCD